MCGGEETLAIKKMDKQAMDLLKDNISPMLKASYKMHSRSQSKHSSTEKKRLNRQPIESLRTPFSSTKKLTLEKHAEIDETVSDKSN